MQGQYSNKEEYIEALTSEVSTTVNGFDREWCKRALNKAFVDRIMIETDGQELGEWIECAPNEPAL